MPTARYGFRVCVLGASLALLVWFAVPAGAQEGSSGAETLSAKEESLRAWWDALPDRRKRTLLHRRKALSHLGKDQQVELLKRARNDEPVLTQNQRKRLQRLRQMAEMKRLRLYTVAAELHALRRSDLRGLREAMQKTGHERARSLRGLLVRQRRDLFARSLTPDERQRVGAMQLEERADYFRKKRRDVFRKLAGYHPRLNQLRELANDGDKQAARELRQMNADLLTLTMLIQRLSPEMQDKALSEIKDLGISQSARKLRHLLRDQWRGEQHRGRRRPRPGRGDAVRPEDNRHRDRRRR